MIGVPPEITQVERRAVKDSGYRVKASEVHLVDEPMAAAIGSGLPVTEAAGNMVIDIGGGTTDIAVISLAGHGLRPVAARRRQRPRRGDHPVHARAHQLLIGERTAEQIKCEIGIGGAARLAALTMEVKGRHLMEGVPRTLITSDGHRDPRGDGRADPARSFRPSATRSRRVPPELCADIYDRGVVLTGGGALLRNLDKRLRDETGLPVLVAENPLTSVVLGAGRMLTDLKLLRKVAFD